LSTLSSSFFLAVPFIMNPWAPRQPLMPLPVNPVGPVNLTNPFNAAYRPYPRSKTAGRVRAARGRKRACHLPARSASAQTVVIFDWDDTLFPTSAVVHQKQSEVTIGDLYTLGKSVYELLRTYISTFGAQNIFIVTNGTEHWILDSLKELSRMYKDSFDALPGDSTQKMRRKDFFAAIYNSFVSLRIPLLSARSVYSDRHPQQFSLWKALMFKSIVKSHFKRHLCSGREGDSFVIISIGDSRDEFEAALEAKRMLIAQNRLNCSDNAVRLHRVKLMEKPAIEEMVKQHAALKRAASVLNTARESIAIHHERGDTAS